MIFPEDFAIFAAHINLGVLRQQIDAISWDVIVHSVGIIQRISVFYTNIGFLTLNIPIIFCRVCGKALNKRGTRQKYCETMRRRRAGIADNPVIILAGRSRTDRKSIIIYRDILLPRTAPGVLIGTQIQERKLSFSSGNEVGKGCVHSGQRNCLLLAGKIE